jgi:hypothetical protein
VYATQRNSPRESPELVGVQIEEAKSNDMDEERS